MAALLLAPGIDLDGEETGAKAPAEAAAPEAAEALEDLAPLSSTPALSVPPAAGAEEGKKAPAEAACYPTPERPGEGASAAGGGSPDRPGRPLAGRLAESALLARERAAGAAGLSHGEGADSVPPPATADRPPPQGGGGDLFFASPAGKASAPAPQTNGPVVPPAVAVEGGAAAPVEAVTRTKEKGEKDERGPQHERLPASGHTPQTPFSPRAEGGGSTTQPARPTSSPPGAAAFQEEPPGERFVITRSDASSVSVSLSPEGLGDLEVEVFLERGAVNGKITAFDPAAREAVAGSIGRIVEALARDGIRVGGFSVSLGGEGRAGTSAYARRSPEEDLSAATPDAFLGPAPARPPRGAGIVDVYA